MNKEDLQQIKDLFGEESKKTEILFKKELKQIKILFRKEFTAQNEDLARMMQDQFTEQDEKFAGIDNNFAMMNAKFAGINTKFDQQKEEIIGEVREMFKPLQDSMDFVINSFIKQDQENTANTSAHDRYNENFYKIKRHINLDTIEAVKRL